MFEKFNLGQMRTPILLTDLLCCVYPIGYIELADVRMELFDIRFTFFEVKQVELFNMTLRRDHILFNVVFIK